MTQYKSNSGINWSYELLGQGECLLFIHGFGGSLAWWKHQVEFFKKDYQILRVDLPGHGQSSWQECSLIGMAQDIKELLDSLGLYRINVIASSFGGLIALELVRLIPEEISRISFVGSLPKFARSDSYSAGLDVDKIRTMSMQFEGNYATILDIFFRSLFTMKERDSNEFKDLKVLRQSEKLPQKEALNHFLTILEKVDLRDRLSSVICPVQFISGEEDYICPKEAMQWIQEHMLNARLDFIKGCGHLPFLTAIKQYNDTLENFLIN